MHSRYVQETYHARHETAQPQNMFLCQTHNRYKNTAQTFVQISSLTRFARFGRAY
jgi:hypothetical protein